MIKVLEVLAQSSQQTLTYTDLIDIALSNPKVAAAIGIQLIMGMLLGYILAKVFKYILAFIAVLIVGSLLNVWSLGQNTEDILSFVGPDLLQYKDVVMKLISTLGVLLVGPVTIGFFIGLLVGWVKK